MAGSSSVESERSKDPSLVHRLAYTMDNNFMRGPKMYYYNMKNNNLETPWWYDEDNVAYEITLKNKEP